MLFNSIAFLIFGPTFFLLYFLLKGRARLWLCLISSYFFYGFWDWRFCSLLAISSIVDFWVGRSLGHTEEAGKRKRLLLVSLCANLGMLGTFKYFDFFSQSAQDLLAAFGLSVSPPLLNIALPIGISFYTFQTLSYTIDVYRRELEPEQDFLNFAVFVSLFPQLVAGPIVRASLLLPQLRNKVRWDNARVARGLELIVWGFFMKVCVADNVSAVVDPRYAKPEAFGAMSHMLAQFYFSFQIYGDFAGYSLIAIGLGRIMGFDFGVNFDRPYFSTGLNELWRRWHISLSSWIKDYLFRPMMSVSRSFVWMAFAFVTTMFLMGLWHGASWNFALFGLYHGLFMVIERSIVGPLTKLCNLLRIPRFLRTTVGILFAYLVFLGSGPFFRGATFKDAMHIYSTMFKMEDMAIHTGQQQIAMVRGLCLIMVVVLFDFLSGFPKVREYYLSRPHLRWIGAACLVWLIIFTGTFTGARFIYFQF